MMTERHRGGERSEAMLEPIEDFRYAVTEVQHHDNNILRGRFKHGVENVIGMNDYQGMDERIPLLTCQ